MYFLKYTNNFQHLSFYLNLCKFLTFKKKMSIFIQQLNPLTGENEWTIQKEDYDFKQEIARSAYADMLHDSERNEKYYEGLQRSLEILRRQGKEIHVLDIGTGTGLLSMMALSLGADFVTACEAFSPMAECARRIFRKNNFKDKICLIGKRSTELEVGNGKDMERKANLLVAEVFDTELIGEGALETFLHAKKHLLTEDALIVPSEGTIYAQVVSSDFVKSWNRLKPFRCKNSKEEIILRIPDKINRCPGLPSVHDLQLSEISSKYFTPVSEPLSVFTFDWSGRTKPLIKNNTANNQFTCINPGECEAVFMWWDIKMDPLGEISLSCAPLWEHPIIKQTDKSIVDINSKMIPWRDHWMQAIYYFPQSLQVDHGDKLSLLSSHDEYSLWFDIKNSESCSEVFNSPVCICNLHTVLSKSRIGQLNDCRRRDFYLNILEKNVNKNSVCLFLGNFPYLGIVAAKMGAAHVYLHETNLIGAKMLEEFILANGMEDKVTVLSSDLKDITVEQLSFNQATLVFGEPYFTTSMLPWHSVQFFYLLQSGQHLISTDAVILPDTMQIKYLPVQYRDLWKIRAPLGTCCGFDLSDFDELIEKACNEVDASVEPQPLWEYPSTALGQPQTLLSVALGKNLTLKSVSESVTLPIEAQDGVINGLSIWADFNFGPNDVFTTGPTEPVIIGNEVIWDVYTRQGVYLFKNHTPIVPSNSLVVHSNTEFKSSTGAINFNFEIKRES